VLRVVALRLVAVRWTRAPAQSAVARRWVVLRREVAAPPAAVRRALQAVARKAAPHRVEARATRARSS
jgi:hypothetical protein